MIRDQRNTSNTRNSPYQLEKTILPLVKAVKGRFFLPTAMGKCSECLLLLGFPLIKRNTAEFPLKKGALLEFPLSKGCEG
jgi:hypothetical protein